MSLQPCCYLTGNTPATTIKGQLKENIAPVFEYKNIFKHSPTLMITSKEKENTKSISGVGKGYNISRLLEGDSHQYRTSIASVSHQFRWFEAK